MSEKKDGLILEENDPKWANTIRFVTRENLTVLTIHADGRFELNPDIPQDEAVVHFLRVAEALRLRLLDKSDEIHSRILDEVHRLRLAIVRARDASSGGEAHQILLNALRSQPNP